MLGTGGYLEVTHNVRDWIVKLAHKACANCDEKDYEKCTKCETYIAINEVYKNAT
jgi:hypothetical protein